MIIGISGKIGSGKDTIASIINYLLSTKELEDSISYEEYLTSQSKYIDRDKEFEIKKFADKLKDVVCILINCTRDELEDQDFKNKELGEEWWYYNTGDNDYPILIPFLTVHSVNDKINKSLLKYLIKLTPRKLLQLIGTECGRKIIHPNIWVNSLFSNYQLNDYSIDQTSSLELTKSDKDIRYPNWAITDLRFKNELEAIKNKAGFVVRVDRYKTSIEWQEEYFEIQVLDPNGWNRKNLQYSWHEEKITLQEYKNRLLESTCKFNVDIKEYFYEHESETELDNHKSWDYVIKNDGAIKDLVEKVKIMLKDLNLI